MMKHHNYALGLTWTIILFVVPLPLIQTLAAGLPLAYSDEFQAIYFGAIAYAWMLAAIYLSTRPKWLDRLIGLPDMYLIHGVISIAAIFLAYLHQNQTQSVGWIKTTGDWAYWLLLGLLGYSLLFMAGWLTSRIPVIKRIKAWLEPIFRHEVSVWIHRLNLVATVLVFIHVILINYVTAIKPFMIWFYLYSILTLTTYVWSKYRDSMLSPRATLIENTEIAENVHELRLKLTTNLELLPGDFVFISFPTIEGLKELHPFSLVNSPTNNNAIQLAIRGDGDFTKALANIPEGTPVRVVGGYGRYQQFLNERPEFTNVVIIAGGVGIVPLLSMMEANANRVISLFYTAHRAEDLLYPEKIMDWRRRGKFQAYQQVGRFVDSEVLRRLPKDFQTNSLFLIGGPSSMMRHWKRVFKKYGVPAGHLYAEEFNW